jgi:hypothetical protein
VTPVLYRSGKDSNFFPNTNNYSAYISNMDRLGFKLMDRLFLIFAIGYYKWKGGNLHFAILDAGRIIDGPPSLFNP